MPDFSFQGEELSLFAIRPVFRDLEIPLSIPSSYTNYVEKQTIEAASEMVAKYGAAEPSFFYRFRPTTTISSIFNGDKAYRNYFVKRFLLKDYRGVIKAYKDYKDDFSTPEFKEEARILYAFSLFNRNDKTAVDTLADSCLNGKEFRNEVCDKYMEILWDNKDYDKIAEIGGKLHNPLPAYTFSVYVLSVFKNKEFAKGAELISENPDLIFKYQDFNDLRAAAEYYKNNYGNVAKLAPYCTDNLVFIQSDSHINLGRISEAEQFLKKVSSHSDRRYLEAKIKIRQKKLKEAVGALKLVTNESERFELLNYYMALEFPALNRDFLSQFGFVSPEYADYPVYYEGLQKFASKIYSNAAELFARVKTTPELIWQAKFYRGVALMYIDPAKAESEIIDILNYSRDSSQIAASRYLLAQVYYLKKEYDEAVQLLDGCPEQYCRQLRSEIYLHRGRYDMAMTNIEGVDSFQARLIRATAYFNSKDYDAARREIEEAKTTSEEFTHLKMMLAFKEGNVAEGTAILTANQKYRPVLYDGVKELMLAGDYTRAGKLLSSVKNLPPDMEILNAKLLAWSGKTKEARAAYKKLTKESSVAYDAFSGIIALEKTSQGEMEAIASVLKELQRAPEFQQKDMLLSQMASKTARAGENVLLIQIINIFFPAYANSPYANEMYAERARLFYTTGRSQECLRDIADAVGKSPLLAQDLRFIKAQCTEAVNMQNALTDYRAMFAEKGQFYLPAAVKIMELSDKSAEILSIAGEFKKDNPLLYTEGVRRYAETAKPDELKDNEKFIKTLLNDKSKALSCAGLFALARMQNENGKGGDAAKTYHKIYLTDPEDYFAAPALDAAIKIYDKLKMPKETEQMKALRKKIKKR
ncbi:MAG: hypothetical protein LBH05_09285 [Deferribacteraceae bacterium]|nr:hypothetical protein [Deferribacteraceae bacterium]